MSAKTKRRPRTFTHLAVSNNSRTACSRAGLGRMTVAMKLVTCRHCQRAVRRWKALIPAIAELVQLALKQGQPLYALARGILDLAELSGSETKDHMAAGLERTLRRVIAHG